MYVAPGYGMTRSTMTVKAGQSVTKSFALTPNLAVGQERRHGPRLERRQPQRRRR